jgi:hypothetical protein
VSGRDGPTWGADMDARDEARYREAMNSYIEGKWITRGGGPGPPPARGSGCGPTSLLVVLAGLAVAVAW